MKRTFQFKNFMCMLLVMSLFLSVTMISTGFSSDPTQLYVDPQTVEWNPLLGETFKVNASIADVSDLQSFEFKLYWNTTLLDLVEAEPQPFLKPLWIVTKNEIDEILGRYWVNVESMADPPGANGSGPLVTLTFKMTFEPVWPENVTCALDLADTKLVDSGGGLISHEVVDGEYWCYSTPLLSIATTTDNPWYWLAFATIHIYGNLTLGYSPVSDGVVALEVDNPLNEEIVIRSLSTGTPPANQIVEIIDVTPCGGPPNYNPKNNFNKGDRAYFNVTIKNNDDKSREVLIAINVYDVDATVIGKTQFQGSVIANSTMYQIFPFDIIGTASIGQARVYANVLTGWPRDGGTAYCPEKWADFEINEGGGGATTGSSPEGTYDLTFELLLREKAGNYTIYATSNYTIPGLTQKATNNVKFEVKVPDINDDGVVNILDLVTVALAFDSRPGDPNWNPDADLNGDGIVNILDIVIVAGHFDWEE